MNEGKDARGFGRSGVFMLLGISLLCNIAVFFVPFMQLRRGIVSEDYTIFHSVGMLWEANLYLLAVLVVGFSVLFPFLKLFIIGFATWTDDPSPPVRRWLRWVESPGKWSMLDAFLVCLGEQLSIAHGCAMGRLCTMGGRSVAVHLPACPRPVNHAGGHAGGPNRHRRTKSAR